MTDYNLCNDRLKVALKAGGEDRLLKHNTIGDCFQQALAKQWNCRDKITEKIKKKDEKVKEMTEIEKTLDKFDEELENTQSGWDSDKDLLKCQCVIKGKCGKPKECSFAIRPLLDSPKVADGDALSGNEAAEGNALSGNEAADGDALSGNEAAKGDGATGSLSNESGSKDLVPGKVLVP